MNITILNREFQHPSDGWYQVEALGKHPNRAAGIVQVIDKEAAQRIVNRFNTDAAAGQLRHGSEMLIDHEHFSDQPDQETRAYGWLQELQNRDDGIYGRIRWTSTGKAAVDGGDYRFFSTEYTPADLQVLNKASGPGVGNKLVRPVRLAGLTLTNMNNNRGQKPITNRESICADTSVPADSKHQQKVVNKKMKTVCTLLGLSAEADEASVHAAVSKLLNRADILPADLITLKNRATTLESENQTLLAEQLDGILAEHKITDAKVVNRLKPVLTPLKNREERLTCLADFGFKIGGAPAPATAAAPARILNRGTGNTPSEESVAGADDQAIAKKIKNRATALVVNGRSWDSAWKQAAQEVAEAK